MEKTAAYFTPAIFKRYPEVVAAHSLRDPSLPASFSLLYAASEAELAANRRAFAEALGFRYDHLAFPKLTHGDTVLELPEEFNLANRPEADAIMTNRAGWLIGVAVADCVVVLLYDPAHHAVGAVHSGWRGSRQNITAKTVGAMTKRYGSRPANLVAFVSAAPQAKEYEVGHDVSQQFDPRYSQPKSADKDWFDNQAVVRDQLLAAGVMPEHFEVSPDSTISDPRFHSYRRDGADSGRMLVAIGLRDPGR